MKTYIIGYDLNSPRGKDDYEKMHEAIQKLSGTWWHHLDSTWIIKTNQSAETIAKTLKPFLDKGDELLVIRAFGEAAWYGFNEKGSQWLKNNLSDS